MALHIGIDGTEVKIAVNSAPKVSSTIDQRDTAEFVVIDDAGINHYEPGQQVTVIDDSLGLVFAGFIDNDDEQVLIPNPTIKHTIQAIGNHYHADKRHYHGPEYNNRLAGDIITDFVEKVLKEEGVTANYARSHASTQADFASGTLTNVTATNNNGGQLELSLAGADGSWTIGPTTIPTFSTIKMTGSASQGYNNNYAYQKIYMPNYVIQSGDTFYYDVWVQSDSPAIVAGVDFVCSDGTTLRDAGSNVGNDQNGLGPHPNTDLSGYANDQWYSRAFGLGASFVGKTIRYITCVLEGDNTGNYTAYFRRIKMMTADGLTTRFTAFGDTTTSLAYNSNVITNGYSNVKLQVVQAHDKSFLTFGSSSLSSVGVVKGSQATWVAPNYPSDAQLFIQTSIDVGASRQAQANNSPISNLTPGMNVGTSQLFVWEYVIQGKDPTACTTAPELFFSVFSASANTTSGTDVFKDWDQNADWNTGTFNGTQSGGQSNLLMTGVTRAFSIYTDYLSTTWFGNSPYLSTYQRTLALQCAANSGAGNCIARCDFAGSTWQNFQAEVDFQVNTNLQMGLLYRTSVWNNTNNTFGYAVLVSNTSISFGHGTNNTTGGWTALGGATVSLANNSWHHLTVIVNGTTHTILLDGVQYISMTDATYNFASYVALRMFNVGTTTGTSYMKNFGILPVAMSGTWVSPSVSLAGASTAGNSLISWDNSQSQTDGLTYIPQGASITVESSLDGGFSYQACANGGAIPNLSSGTALTGKSIQFRVTLSTQNASYQPTLGGLSFWCGTQYKSVGIRISPALSLSPVGRVGSASMSWVGNTPTNTNIVVDTSPDGTTWTNIGSGASGSGAPNGINGQPMPTTDDFSTNTVASYISTARSGSSAGTWTWNTTQQRLEAAGNGAVLLYNQLNAHNIDVQFDTDLANNCGIVWRWTNSSNFYEVVVQDSNATYDPNTLRLYKNVAGTQTQIGATATINFVRGTIYRIRVTMIDGAVTAYFDGAQVTAATDTTLAGAGQIGMTTRNNGAYSDAHFYNLWIQPLGDTVTNANLYHRVTLSTTDPTVAPTASDLSLSVRDPSIADGALIPSTQYSVLNSDEPISSHLDDLATQSDHTWTINSLSQFVFQPRTGKPAPWIATGANMLASSVKVSNIQQEYRNVQWMSGGSDLKTFTQAFTGDGHTTTFTLSYPVDGITSIYLDNVQVSAGTKGTSGYSYYYQQGSTALAQDSSMPPLTSADQLIVKYVGRVPVTVKVTHQRAVSKRKGTEKTTSGKVEHKLKMPTVATKQQAIKKAKQVVEYYTKNGRILEFTTLRSGLVPGMLLTVMLPQHGFHSDQMLIESVDVSWEITGENGVISHTPFFDVKATMGAVIGDWTRLFAHIHGKK